jgi:hypothetical protein
MAVHWVVLLIVLMSFANADSIHSLYKKATLPSSAQSVVSKKEKVSDPLTLIELNCGRKLASEMRVNSPWAQIKGHFCKPSRGRLVEIINESNGFTASVFDIGQDQYKTDLIQLQNGTNKILIRYQTVDGLSEEQIVFVDSSYI